MSSQSKEIKRNDVTTEDQSKHRLKRISPNKGLGVLTRLNMNELNCFKSIHTE